jgi:hypothetical protein
MLIRARRSVAGAAIARSSPLTVMLICAATTAVWPMGCPLPPAQSDAMPGAAREAAVALRVGLMPGRGFALKRSNHSGDC